MNELKIELERHRNDTQLLLSKIKTLIVVTGLFLSIVVGAYNLSDNQIDNLLDEQIDNLWHEQLNNLWAESLDYYRKLLTILVVTSAAAMIVLLFALMLIKSYSILNVTNINDDPNLVQLTNNDDDVINNLYIDLIKKTIKSNERIKNYVNWAGVMLCTVIVYATGGVILFEILRGLIM